MIVAIEAGIGLSAQQIDLLACLAGLAPWLISIEARELIALGRQVRLVPPSDVKACLNRGKNDATDAEAICEPVTRPSIRFVPEEKSRASSFFAAVDFHHLLPCRFRSVPAVGLNLAWRRGIQSHKRFLEMK